MAGICHALEKSVQVLQQKTQLFERSATLQIKNNCEIFYFILPSSSFTVFLSEVHLSVFWNGDVVQPCEPLLSTDVSPEHEDQQLVSRTFIYQLNIKIVWKQADCEDLNVKWKNAFQLPSEADQHSLGFTSLSVTPSSCCYPANKGWKSR